MTKIQIARAILFAAALSCCFASHAQTATPQQVLQKYVSDLQRSPDDTVLRERIIRHVQSMKKAPPIPEEARRYFVEGNALLKAAKDQKGYELAIDAYHQCLLIAPWWPEANYNFAVALELANRFDSSMNALKLYIATNPGEEESRKAQDKIYEIGAKKIIAAREREESSPQAGAAREQNKLEDLLKKIDGRRYTSSGFRGGLGVIDVSGKVLVVGSIAPGQQGPDTYTESMRLEIKDRAVSFQNPNASGVLPVEIIYTISESGDSIIEHRRFSDGDVRDFVYHWKR